MVLDTIYVVRHGHRLTFNLVHPLRPYGTGPNDDTRPMPYYTTMSPTPTGIPTDPQLASYGVDQSYQLADRLATIQPRIDRVYSSPYYRCLQTIAPTLRKLRASERNDDANGQAHQPSNLLVRVDRGLGEFHGRAPFMHPAPAPLDELAEDFFPGLLDVMHESTIVPSQFGETLEQLHDRFAYCLYRIIEECDREGDTTASDSDSRGPSAILISTHAAGVIAIGRALTGKVPDDFTEDDFRCGTCSLSIYKRRTHGSSNGSRAQKRDANVPTWDPFHPNEIPDTHWRSGQGLSDGWDCEANGDCSHLRGGEERHWHFSGDESFLFEAEETKTATATPSRSNAHDTQSRHKL